MLSKLKENNRILKEKLKCIKNENTRANQTVRKCKEDENIFTSATRRPRSAITRCRSIDDCRVSALTPSSGRSGRSLLSDHAKSIRGEASKRIDNLLLDWKDYKKKAEEELREYQPTNQSFYLGLHLLQDYVISVYQRLKNRLRQRFRVEQNLRDKLLCKEKQMEKLFEELRSMKLFAEEQRQMIDQLNEELECEAKCRIKCSELEDELKNISRCVENLSGEIRLRDEIIRSTEQERDEMSSSNIALQQKNCKLKNRIHECEQDVNATRTELEILDDMVHTMHGRKETIVAGSRPPSVRSLSPCSSICDYYLGNSKKPTCVSSTPKRSKGRSPTPAYGRKANVTMGTPRKTTRATTLCCNENDWNLCNKKSALSTLRSLQREHAAKCNFLAENIKKLKDESRAKERKITDLQKSRRCNRSYF